VRRFCKVHGFPQPRTISGRARLILYDSDAKRLGLNGSRLVLRAVGRSFSIAYRTNRPDQAQQDVEPLFRRLGVRLNPAPTRTYQEVYVVLRSRDASIVRLHLPGFRGGPASSLMRKGLRTLYGRELLIPVGVKGTLRVAVVMYQPRKTWTPDYVKLEIKGPTDHGKQMTLPRSSRNRMIGFLRYVLGRAGVRAVLKPEKPKPWIGLLLKDEHKDGPVQRRVRAILAGLRSGKVTLEGLARFLERSDSVTRSNLIVSLRKMECIGDVALTTRYEQICGVRLLDYSKIKVAPQL
jgi:hypothetical protein